MGTPGPRHPRSRAARRARARDARRGAGRRRLAVLGFALALTVAALGPTFVLGDAPAAGPSATRDGHRSVRSEASRRTPRAMDPAGSAPRTALSSVREPAGGVVPETRHGVPPATAAAHEVADEDRLDVRTPRREARRAVRRALCDRDDPGRRLETARAVIAEGLTAEHLDLALTALAELDPSAVASALAVLSAQAPSRPEAAERLAASVVLLRDAPGALTDLDLRDLHAGAVGGVRRELARALALRGADDLLRDMEQASVRDLGAADSAVRASAVRALTDRGRPEAARQVVGLIHDEDPSVRLAVVDAVRVGAVVDDAEAEGLLRSLLDDPDAGVRRVVRRALGRCDVQATTEDALLLADSPPVPSPGRAPTPGG